MGLAKQHARLTRWLEEFLGEIRVLETTERTTSVYARVRRQLRAAGTPMPENDVWIAASAVEHGLPLVSRDKHFKSVEELEVLTW